jgi:hypothetical protein
MRSTDHGLTWSDPITGPGVTATPVSDPDTGAPVRDGSTLLDVTVDPNIRSVAHPNGGNLYAVWADGRFSGFTHADIAFSMSSDGGLSWTDPIKINQAPTNISAGNQQAFTPSVAVSSDGTVAVTYYDFRNNTTAAGLPTDYWLVHASGSFTSPTDWQSDEKRLTDTSFNMENAAPTSRGYFLGDYQGLAGAGSSFYALFGQAGSGSSDPSNIWFRDPPPAQDVATTLAYVPTAAAPSAMQALATALHVSSSSSTTTANAEQTTMTPDLNASIAPTSSTSSVAMMQPIQSRTGPKASASHQASDQAFEDESCFETIDDDLLSELASVA